MRRQLERKAWVNRSRQTTGNVMITFPESNVRRSKTLDRFAPVSIQRVKVNSRARQQYYDEYIGVDKEKQAATGRWILNVIAAREAYKKTQIANKNNWYIDTKQSTDKKKQSFHSRLSSKVEPIEKLSSQFINTQIHETPIKINKNQNINPLPHKTILSPTTIDDRQITPISSFSSSTSVDIVRTPDRSSKLSTQTRSNSHSIDYSTDEFKDGEEHSCISKRITIICIILSIIFIIAIIVAVFLTIFLWKNGSTSSSNTDPKSLLVPFSTINNFICPTQMFNITDPLCKGEIPYNYYSCYQMATSTSFTIQFTLQHDTIFGHWYFDDISVIQNDMTELIINGGFEFNLTGWILNISSNSTPETYVDTTIGLAHTGSAYLYGGSKNSPAYIEQTFNVIQGEYINISFWWGYDGGLKLGDTCEAIGQLIPL